MEPSEAPDIVSLEILKSDSLLVAVHSKFKETYGNPPDFFVRVPGRVNLIGEHIDYCGYSVLPMALEQNILVAVKAADNLTLNIVNVDSKYAPYQGDINSLSFNIGQEVYWYNYILCGIRGIIELSSEKKWHGMLCAVAGNVLPNSGLSSSSALVCAAALAMSHANKVAFTKQELASCCARSERYIGTEGGGMDQAIAFLANAGCAKHISFRPLRATDVQIPQGLAIIVGHSLAELNKAANDQFNCRVAECRLAATILAKKKDISNWREMTVLADVHRGLKLDLSDMISLTSEILPKETYNKDEVCEILGLSCQELESLFLPENTRGITSFKLRQRATHVFQEALRVEQFRECCKNGGSGEVLGQLMNLSHDSLRDLYECSHPKLDKLVLSARKRGALGARLTGAGWGGCMVALTTEEHAETLISSLKLDFYDSEDISTDCKSLVFNSQPGMGAVIIQ